VLASRYLLRTVEGKLKETPDALFRRVAKAVSAAELQWGSTIEAEKWEERFYQLLSSLQFLPNSTTLMNAGTQVNQLSACFVLPLEDNPKVIFDTLEQAAMLQLTGAGTWFNFFTPTS
jgi:ribonucleoside-diphosphate reductase alpha chain